jgi:hypothetical protein
MNFAFVLEYLCTNGPFRVGRRRTREVFDFRGMYAYKTERERPEVQHEKDWAKTQRAHHAATSRRVMTPRAKLWIRSTSHACRARSFHACRTRHRAQNRCSTTALRVSTRANSKTAASSSDASEAAAAGTTAPCSTRRILAFSRAYTSMFRW